MSIRTKSLFKVVCIVILVAVPFGAHRRLLQMNVPQTKTVERILENPELGAWNQANEKLLQWGKLERDFTHSFAYASVEYQRWMRSILMGKHTVNACVDNEYAAVLMAGNNITTADRKTLTACDQQFSYQRVRILSLTLSKITETNIQLLLQNAFGAEERLCSNQEKCPLRYEVGLLNNLPLLVRVLNGDESALTELQYPAYSLPPRPKDPGPKPEPIHTSEQVEIQPSGIVNNLTKLLGVGKWAALCLSLLYILVQFVRFRPRSKSTDSEFSAGSDSYRDSPWHECSCGHRHKQRH